MILTYGVERLKGKGKVEDSTLRDAGFVIRLCRWSLSLYSEPTDSKPNGPPDPNP
jgi:hypothetical protein